MVTTKIDIDKYFIVRVQGYMPETTPNIGVAYVTFYVRVEANKVTHANLLCIGIGDGHKTLYMSAVMDNEYIRKHRDIMVNSNLNGFKFGIYFIFDGEKNNKKIYLFDQPFDPATLEKLSEEKNDLEAINYFYTKFDGKCSKLEYEKDEKGLKAFYFTYTQEGKAKEVDFIEVNGEIRILGFKQTKESEAK